MRKIEMVEHQLTQARYDPATCRPRFADRQHLFDPNGKVWRFRDDPPDCWRLHWNDTKPGDVPEKGAEHADR